MGQLIRPLVQPRLRQTFTLAQRVASSTYLLAAGPSNGSGPAPGCDSQHSLTYGTDGLNLRGFQSISHPVESFGSLSPSSIAGLPVFEWNANTGNNLNRIVLGTSENRQQIPGVTNIEATYQFGSANFPIVTYVWNGGDASTGAYQVTDGILSLFFDQQIGSTHQVCLKFS